MRRAAMIFGCAIAALGFLLLLFGMFAPQLDPTSFEAAPSLFMDSATQTILVGGFLFVGGLICTGLSRRT